MWRSGWFDGLAPQKFFESYWNRDSIVLRSSRSSSFKLDQFEGVLRTAIKENASCCFVEGGIIQADSVAEAMGLAQAGATIRISSLQKLYPPVASWLTGIELDFGCPVNVNAYLTMSEGVGVGAHYDDHHVFAVQVAGRKGWRLGSILAPNPGPEFQFRPVAEPPMGSETVLETGDVLYVPPGMWHQVSAQGLSLHLAVGVHPPTIADAIRSTLKSAAERQPIVRSHQTFALTPEGCKYRTPNLEEFDRLLTLLRREHSRLSVPPIPDTFSLKAEARGLDCLDSETRDLVEWIWSRFEKPVALYLRGSTGRNQQDDLRRPWDIDVYLFVAGSGAIDPTSESIVLEAAGRFPRLPPLDISCLVLQDFLEDERQILKRLSLLYDGRLLFGNPIKSMISNIPMNYSTSIMLMGVMVPMVQQMVDYMRRQPHRTDLSRIIAKAALRLASVPMVAEGKQFTRDPAVCRDDLLKRAPCLVGEVWLLWNVLTGEQHSTDSVVSASEKMISLLSG